MKTTLRTLVLLSFMTSVAYAQGPEPIVMDFENLPVHTKTCPSGTADRGVVFVGVHVINGWFTGLNETRVLSATQAHPRSFTCAENPVEIRFPELASEVEFDLITPNDIFTIKDDTGWSRTFSVRAEANATTPATNPTFYRTRIVVPTTGVKKITIKDHCSNLTPNPAACTDFTTFNSQWRIVLDNLEFQMQRPCLAINGPTQIEPKPFGADAEALAFAVEVTDCEGTYLPDISVETKVTVDAKSGGHNGAHATTTRPTGGLRDEGATGAATATIVRKSDHDGMIYLEFVPPEVSGKHTIDAKCTKVTCLEPDPPLEVEVKVAGLKAIDPYLFYTLFELDGTGRNIGDTPQHKNVNHHLIPKAADNLRRLALFYSFLLGEPIPEKLHINDASLPDGGLFDIDGAWTAPHKYHRKGRVVDIRGNQAPGAVPDDPYYHRALYDAAIYAGIEARWESFKTKPWNNHFHVLLTKEQQ